ncbi:ribonuclease III [Coprinopsis marcescibilis]|uniref:Ribonuclease III n=1 Tax=Coprinopsis marcescibilis TaxID=230819 RepID=A0A5C3LCM0_COPMA|nr:ribonuclease III [Coprinopsis marcescibilis]
MNFGHSSFLLPELSRLKRSHAEHEPVITWNKEKPPRLPRISNTDTVLQIFTHPSLRRFSGSDQCSDNERLSHLGKVVMDSVMTEILFDWRPHLTAAQISDKREALLSDDLFDDWVRHYELLKKLRCDPALRKSSSIYMPKETRAIWYAYIGGVYIDSGAGAVRTWIEQLLGQTTNAPATPSSDQMMVDTPRMSIEPHAPPLKKVKAESLSPSPAPSPVFFGSQPPATLSTTIRQLPQYLAHNPGPSVTRANPLAPAQPNLPFLPLFNQTAAQRRVTVTYDAQFSGPSHAGTWVVRCVVNGIPKGEGTGSSKQVAKEEAARQAYYAMGWT